MIVNLLTCTTHAHTHTHTATLYSGYESSLSPAAQANLDKKLDWDHGDVNKDLEQIADYMLDWEEKLAAKMALTEMDIFNLKAGTSNGILLRYSQFHLRIFPVTFDPYDPYKSLS